MDDLETVRSRRNTSPRVARISALGWSWNHSRPRQVLILRYWSTWICWASSQNGPSCW